MKKQLIFLSISLYLAVCKPAYGQTGADSLINDQMVFNLENDTLYSNTGLKFFEGKQLVIGEAAGDEGYFRSIIHRKTALVPSIWGQDMRYEYAIENHVNKKKSREKVKSTLQSGNLLTIKRISYNKTAKPHFYMLTLKTDAEEFFCDIRFALLLKELLLQP